MLVGYLINWESALYEAYSIPLKVLPAHRYFALAPIDEDTGICIALEHWHDSYHALGKISPPSLSHVYLSEYPNLLIDCTSKLRLSINYAHWQMGVIR